MGTTASLRLTREPKRESDQLLSTVRTLAQKEQTGRAQVFLSLREAAAHFAVPVSQMRQIYQRLREEGLLISIRGAHTMLAGTNSTRELIVRGLVGLPFSIPRFQMLRGYRESYFYLCRELDEAGFAVLPLPFVEWEIWPAMVAESAHEAKTDIVVWLRPHGASDDTVLRLRDRGIRFVGVNAGGIVDDSCRYEVQRRQAVRTILRAWSEQAGIRAVVVVRAGKQAVGEAERLARLRELAQGERIQLQVATATNGSIARFIKGQCRKNTGILLAESAAAILETRAADTIADVLTSCRVGLIDGPLQFPFLDSPPDGAADFIVIDWLAIASRVVDDLQSGEAFNDTGSVVFEAVPHLQARISEIRRERQRLAVSAASALSLLPLLSNYLPDQNLLRLFAL